MENIIRNTPTPQRVLSNLLAESEASMMIDNIAAGMLGLSEYMRAANPDLLAEDAHQNISRLILIMGISLKQSAKT